MSINLALESALSGLLTSQKALDVVSNNISNLNTPGYSRKVLVEESNVVNGVGAGVMAQSIQRSVDQGLTNTLQTANGTLTQFTSADSYYSQMQNMFGTPSDQSSISSLIQTMANAVQTMESTPDQTVTTVTNAASQVTNSLQTMSTKIQASRADADQQIGAAVTAVNTALGNIANLNNEIATNGVSGVSTDDLKDQRDQQLKTLASYINFVAFDRPDGSLSIYTNQGSPLLDAQAQTVNHNSTAAVEPRMSFDAASGTGALQGVSVNGKDISSQITNGKLAALLQVRDSILPNLQSQIDTLAQAMQTTLNQVNNRGTSWPTGGQSFTGSKTFIDPAQQRISLSGGDSSMVLVNADGSEKARTTISTIMQSYLQSANIPLTDSYSINQLADGMNGWLNTQFNTTGITYAQVNPSGQFSIQLPQTSTVSLAFRDQRTQQFESGVSSDNLTSASGGKAMNVTGPLTFRDSAGNVYSTTVSATDSLMDIANKINALGGLTASMTAVSGSSPQLYQLQVTNNAGNDMTLDPDAPSSGATAVSGLGINASRSQAASDVAVNFNADGTGTNFTSSGYVSASVQANVTGELSFRDSNGLMANVLVSATDSLATIAQHINAANPRSLNASVSTAGNRAHLVVTNLAGNQMSIDGSGGGYQSSPAAAFSSAGTALTVTSGGTAYTVNFAAGSNLGVVAGAINTNAVMTAAGIKATVGTDGTNSWLSVTNASGLPLSFSGNATGNGANLLQFNLNPSDALGLAPPPDQTVAGFSNFLGLNDLLVTGRPVTTFESQTLTKNFTTTTSSNLDLSSAEWVNGDPATGGPQSFNLNFAAGSTLADIAKQINAQAVTYDSTHLQLGAFKAQAGTLTVGNGIVPIGTVSLGAGDSLSTVAAKINANTSMAAAGVRAIVATDGSNEWLRVYDQQGVPLNFSGPAQGQLAGQLAFNNNQLVTAAIAVDGSGQRLRVYSNNNRTLQATGTLTTQTN
ncbi:MAG TPA: flagellar hook-associated protein FlgK, partial [Rhodospirillaceae bacterium]|nr:flagellar hook-associated protein FlgK [Rhodospirillaceae bacterium]